MQADPDTNLPAYSADDLRLTNVLPFMLPNSDQIAARSGVLPSGVMVTVGSTTMPDDLRVYANTTPNATVKISKGKAVIQTTTAANKGAYLVTNTGIVTLTAAAADAALPRLDAVAVKISDPDTEPSGTARQGEIVLITGTPAASPVSPALPTDGQYLKLADVRIESTATENPIAIAAGDITDRRQYTTCHGGKLYTKDSSQRPANPYPGEECWDEPLKVTVEWTGSKWRATSKKVITYTPASAVTRPASGTNFNALNGTVSTALTFTVPPEWAGEPINFIGSVVSANSSLSTAPIVNWNIDGVTIPFAGGRRVRQGSGSTQTETTSGYLPAGLTAGSHTISCTLTTAEWASGSTFLASYLLEIGG